MSDGLADKRQSLRLAAMNALARREHARGELARKLDSRHGGSAEEVAQVLDRLAEEGLQSDARFAEAFSRSRYQRGQGPVRIAAELRQRGVADHLVEAGLASVEADWFELARETLIRRFGERPPADKRDKARRMRFLQYRGFDADQIRYALQT